MFAMHSYRYPYRTGREILYYEYMIYKVKHLQLVKQRKRSKRNLYESLIRRDKT